MRKICTLIVGIMAVFLVGCSGTSNSEKEASTETDVVYGEVTETETES